MYTISISFMLTVWTQSSINKAATVSQSSVNTVQGLQSYHCYFCRILKDTWAARLYNNQDFRVPKPFHSEGYGKYVVLFYNTVREGGGGGFGLMRVWSFCDMLWYGVGNFLLTSPHRSRHYMVFAKQKILFCVITFKFQQLCLIQKLQFNFLKV